MTPRPVANEPVRTATAAGTLGGTGVLASVLQVAQGVDWNSGVEALLATGPGVAGVAAAVAAAAAGRKRAWRQDSVDTAVTDAEVRGLIRGHNAGMAGTTAVEMLADTTPADDA